LIAKQSLSTDLDKSGNRLLIRRAPGDMLRVVLPQDHLVFSAGDTFRFEIEPRLMPIPVGTNLQLRMRLLTVGGSELNVQEQTIKTTAEESTPASVQCEFKVPLNDGVYDVAIEAFEPAALRWTKPKLVAERHVQFAVVKDRSPVPLADVNTPWTSVMEIDPANPRWYERFVASSFLPNLGQGNFGNAVLQPWQQAIGSAVQLPPNGASGEIHWQAYPLSVNRPGVPHILEVEYPSDLPQTLGISVVEPNASGAVLPIGLDSGVSVVDESLPAPVHWARHRLLFWPRTKNPVLLLTNRRSDTPAVFGKIRVLAGPSKLPHAPFVGPTLPERLVAGYQSRPLVPENFGAPQALDVVSGRSLDDWQTFFDSAQRLVEYLNYVGYSGQMLTVMADASTIYPSALVEPTLRYDTGAQFENAQDPLRKDVLELMLRLFDRDALKLIPTLQFASPLPELEEQLRRGDSSGIRLIGSNGETYVEKFPSRHGLAPFYNPLNQHVQQAILNVVHEIVQRYSQHPSFAGLAFELSADSYTQLPGELWGLDDDTISRFQHDTGIQVPGAGSSRFSDRADFLGPAESGDGVKPQREAWLKWRAGILAEFYRRLQKELTDVRPDGVFYLASTNLFDGPEAQRLLRPALPAKAHIDQVLLTLGIEPDLLRDQRGLVFLRPTRFSPTGPLTGKGVDLELDRASELDEQFHKMATSGAIFLNNQQTVRLPSFEAKSPFGKDKTCVAEINAELVPSERRNRQRFVHSLATSDPDCIFDGGWLLPLGQEDSLVDLIAAYRRLPVGKFETYKEPTPPMTIRTLTRDNSTYVYLVNDSEWPLTALLTVDLPPGCRIEELSGERRLPALTGNHWTLPMEPFDVIAVRFLAPDAHINQAQITLDETKIKPWLANRVHDLLQRKAMLANQLPLPGLSNPSFELPVKAGQIPGWSLLNAAGGSLTLDVEGSPVPLKFVGKQAARLESKGPPVSLRSDAIPSPATGRISVSVWLRTENPQQQPILRLAVEGYFEGRSYYRCAQVGQGQNPIGGQWSHFQLQIDDLPPTDVEKLQVRFDLMTPGCVWIDDVQVFDLAFTDAELDHLGKIVALADFQLQHDQLADCMHELEGYWPRFLSTYVPLQAPLANQQQQQGTPPPKSEEKSAKKPPWWSLR
jgi:hypothetical protein